MIGRVWSKASTKADLEGETNGWAEKLLRHLRKRYGTVPDAGIERVHAAGIKDLDRWANAVLDAPNLDVIFDPSMH
jgi:hypothetical protein